jgi:hypothetical protein
VSTTPHKDLDDEVGQWARENGVPPPADEQPPASDAASDAHASDTASDAPKRDDQVDGEEDEDGLPPVDNTPMSDEEKTEAAAETAAMIVGAVDFVMTKFVGQRMALSEKEEAKFVKLATPIVRRRMPKIVARFSDEDRLLAYAGMVYAPKFFSPEPTKEPSTPSGGGGAEREGDNSGTPTEASVDGRKVEATVHDIKRKAGL